MTQSRSSAIRASYPPLAPGEFRWRFALNPDCRKVNDPPNAAARAGPKQRSRAECVHACGGSLRPVLKNARAIHHRVGTREHRVPRAVVSFANVERNPFGDRSVGDIRVPGDTDDLLLSGFEM
jgi:hypothetical protein